MSAGNADPRRIVCPACLRPVSGEDHCAGHTVDEWQAARRADIAVGLASLAAQVARIADALEMRAFEDAAKQVEQYRPRPQP